MNDTDLTPMEFESSHGMLLVNEDGSIHNDSDISDWLLDIAKVDMEELDNYYSIQGSPKCEGGDVLDFGWWDKDGKYNLPERDWRLNTFHNQELTDDEVLEVVDKSFDWIRANRHTIATLPFGDISLDDLKAQKSILTNMIQDWGEADDDTQKKDAQDMEGLLNLLDGIQDHCHTVLGFSEEEVYDLNK